MKNQDNTGVKTDSIVTKLGRAKGIDRSRVWVEGVRLSAAGFTVGARYDLKREADVWDLTLNPEGKRRVSGKGDVPIIDVTGKTVRDAFGDGDSVLVVFTDGLINFYPMA